MNLLRKGAALVAPATALAATLVAALPGVEITDSTFKVLTLSAVGALSLFLLLEVDRPAVADPLVSRYASIDDFYLVLGRDLMVGKGRPRQARISITSTWFEVMANTGGRILQDKFLALVLAVPPNHCEVRVLVAVESDSSLHALLSVLYEYESAWNFHVRAYARNAADRPAFDVVIVDDSVGHAGYIRSGTHYVGGGVRSNDRRFLAFLTDYFDDIWNNAPYTICRSTSGIDQQAVANLRDALRD